MIDPVPLPAGVRDVLPVEAAELRALGDALSAAFRSFGYREVMTPIIEMADVLSARERMVPAGHTASSTRMAA